MACPLCDVVTQGSAHPRFLHDFGDAILVAGEHQLFPGYCVLIAKTHVVEMHDLEPEAVQSFVDAGMASSRAIAQAFTPRKMNHALLGNAVPHLHWHLIPRQSDEPDTTMHPWARADEFAAHETTKEQVRELRQKFSDL